MYATTTDILEITHEREKLEKELLTISEILFPGLRLAEGQNAFLYWYYEGNWDEALTTARTQMIMNKEMCEYYKLMIDRLEEGKPEDWAGTYKATSK